MTLTSQPILPQERTASVDVLRGFALLGVVIANLISFASFVMPAALIEQATAGRINHIYETLFTVLVDNKFVTLFSLLFGYGFGVLIERLKQKGVQPVRFYSWRMLLLLIAGSLHIFLWWGEILHIYAVCGLCMLLFMNASDRNLLLWAAFFMLGASLFVRYMMIRTGAFDPAISEGIYAAYLETSLRPDVASVFKANWQLHEYIYVQCLAEWTELCQAMSKFLIGYWVLRKGILTHTEKRGLYIRRTLPIAAPVALLYIIQTTWFIEFHPKVKHLALRLLIYDFVRIGVLALTLTYCALLVMWYHRKPGSLILQGFRYVGMMSLTNYLMHTLAYVFLLHGVGLGWMGRLNVVETLGVGLAIYAFQIFFSTWWLRHFRFGPAEWVWRQLSYRQWIDIRKKHIHS